VEQDPTKKPPKLVEGCGELPSPILPRWTPEDIDLAIAKLHREKVIRVVANNIKNLDLEIQFCPEEVPVIKLSKEIE
jgi:hypothetical protein